MTRSAAKNRYTCTLLRPTASPRLAAMSLEEPAPRLHSTFALEQLTEVARRSIEPRFVMLMASIFGFDIPPRTYRQLQQALLQGSIEPPEHRIGHDLSYPADYDNRDRIIRIHAHAFDQYLKAPERGWELLAILLHEFGHHLDNLLRQDLAQDTPEGTRPARDAQRDEGARYALAMARFEAIQEGPVSIAGYTLIDAEEARIVVDYRQAMQAIARYQDDNAAGTVEGERERFEAGNSADSQDGYFSHEAIEKDLLELGFTTDERQTIYFGNWLRDYSQLLDPKIVRATDMAKDFPNVLSRQALTKIVDVLATRKFSAQRGFYRELFTVTEEKLGVYRPSEHIDNPRVSNPSPADPTTRDPDFEPWIFPDDALLEVDYQSSMKRYIQRCAQNMQQTLHAAMRAGRTGEGLRQLGAALHVLEDFFSHSNFVELCLIKLNYKVLPWTSKADCRWELPLVTGTFSGLDVVASLAEPVARLIAPDKAWDFKPSVSGQRSDTEKMLQILLSEHQTTAWLDAYQTYLKARDKLSELPGSELVERYWWAKKLPLRLISNAYNNMLRGILTLMGNSVGDVQTHLYDDPNSSGSTDPSHSQLAKDHAEHPFHELAANLARTAVMDVATAMVAYWNRGPGPIPTAVAEAYFVHPQDAQWQDEAVARWAGQNPEAIRRGASKAELDKIQQHVHDLTASTLKTLAQDSMDSWEYTRSYLTDLTDDLNIKLPEFMDDKLSVIGEIGKQFVNKT